MTTSENVAIFDDLVSEITQHYYRARILIAIDGADEKPPADSPTRLLMR